MAIPNCRHIVAEVAAAYPKEWRDAHNPSGGGPHTEAFIKRLAWVLHTTVDARFGLNGKRGNPNDLSDDALNFRGEGPGHDPTNGNQPVTVIDCIQGAGGPNPQPTWQVFADLPGPGAWVQPTDPGGAVPPPPPSDAWTSAHEAIRQQLLGAGIQAIAEQLAYTFPGEQWGRKRTQGGQPSPDTIGRILHGKLWGVRVIGEFHVWGDLDGQVHLPVTAVNHLGEAPPPPPPPPPTPIPADIEQRLADVNEELSILNAGIVKVLDEIAKQREDVLNAVRGQSYDIDASAGYLGRVRGTITPKAR